MNRKGFHSIIAKHIKESRFGRSSVQKMAYFVCTFEHKVNGRAFLKMRNLAPGLLGVKNQRAPIPKATHPKYSDTTSYAAFCGKYTLNYPQIVCVTHRRLTKIL